MMDRSTTRMASAVIAGCARRFAAVVALLGAACGFAGTAAADEVGRLFFTPQQRQELDRRRDTNVVEAETVVVENLVTLNGHVVRSSGKSTTWVNGVPQYDAYRGRAGDRVGIESGNTSVGVKVGQTLDRSRGEVRDPLAGGRIVVPSQR
jgi:hypothetical protein